MSETKRAIPIKMIWMFVTVFLLTTVCSVFFASVGMRVRMLQTILLRGAIVSLMCVGAGFGLSRRCVNLALPGIALFTATLAAAWSEMGMPIGLAVTLAICCGIGVSAINAVFALQGRRSVPLVTALASGLLGQLLTSISTMMLDGYTIRFILRIDYWMMILIGLVLVLGLCFLGSVGGKRQFATNEAMLRDPRCGGRFASVLIGGAMASVAGILQSIYMGAVQPNMFSSYNLNTIFPVLAIAGILIPNARRSFGEALMGHLSVLLAALTHAVFFNYMAYLGIAIFVQYFIIALICLLFLIPNMVIYRRFSDDTPPAEPAPIVAAPEPAPAPVSYAPTSEPAPVSYAPVSEPAPVSYAPVSEPASANQAPAVEPEPYMPAIELSKAPVMDPARESYAPTVELSKEAAEPEPEPEPEPADTNNGFRAGGDL